MHAQAGRAAHQLLDGLELDDARPGIQSAEAQMGLIRNRGEELQEERVKRLRVHVRARVLPVLLVAAVDFLWLRGWLLAVKITIVSTFKKVPGLLLPGLPGLPGLTGLTGLTGLYRLLGPPSNGPQRASTAKNAPVPEMGRRKRW